jgi:hypothetical protein
MSLFFIIRFRKLDSDNYSVKLLWILWNVILGCYAHLIVECNKQFLNLGSDFE